MDGLIFGLVDNGGVLLGAYLGVNMEDWFARKMGKNSNPILGAVLGATGTNLCTDVGGCWLDPTMGAALTGVFVGCAIPMLFIPVVEWARKKWRQINVEDPYDDSLF